MTASNPPENPSLFDLPLNPGADSKNLSRPPKSPSAQSEVGGGGALLPFPETTSEPLTVFSVDPEEPELPFDLSPEEPTIQHSDEANHFLAKSRLLGSVLDFGATLGVALTLMIGLQMMRIEVTGGDWPALLIFLLAFSLFYHVMPLGFWGHTPGMAVAGIDARCRRDGTLTFVQAFQRWLGSVSTVALLGIPLLLLVTGRTLSDRWSRSYVCRRAR